MAYCTTKSVETVAARWPPLPAPYILPQANRSAVSAHNIIYKHEIKNHINLFMPAVDQDSQHCNISGIDSGNA